MSLRFNSLPGERSRPFWKAAVEAIAGPGRLVSLTLGIALVITGTAMGQGGGNANAVGLSLETAAQSAAANSNSGTPSSGSPSSSPSGPLSDSGRSSGPPAGYGAPNAASYSGDSSSGYGESGSGYDSQLITGASAAQRTQVAMMAASQMMAKSIANFFGESQDGADEASAPLTLWEEAALTFYQGDQRKALALYHAHIVCDGEAASAAKASVVYSRLLKRPVWAVRFGISIHPRVPIEFVEDPQPIREDTKIATAAGRGRGVSGRGGSSDDGSGGADEINRAMEARREEASSGNFSDGEGGAAATATMMTLGGSSMDQANKVVDRNLGLVAEIVKEMFSSQHSSGKFGSALTSMEIEGARLAAMKHAIGDASPTDLPMWIPGVDFVGEGSATEMLAKAKTSEVDILMHFDVIVKENRLGPPQYTTRCKLLQVESGETIVLSKAIDKYEIASKESGNRESIQQILRPMFDIIEKKVAVEPMPPLQSQHATLRIEALLSSKKPDSLRNLAEMVMFRSRDLITPDQLDRAFYFAGNEKALALIHEEEVGRYEQAKACVDRDLGVNQEN